jgi:hypothetical protein
LTSPSDRVASVAIFINSINDEQQMDMKVSELFSAEMEPDLKDWGSRLGVSSMQI